MSKGFSIFLTIISIYLLIGLIFMGGIFISKGECVAHANLDDPVLSTTCGSKYCDTGNFNLFNNTQDPPICTDNKAAFVLKEFTIYHNYAFGLFWPIFLLLLTPIGPKS